MKNLLNGEKGKQLRRPILEEYLLPGLVQRSEIPLRLIIESRNTGNINLFLLVSSLSSYEVENSHLALHCHWDQSVVCFSPLHDWISLTESNYLKPSPSREFKAEQVMPGKDEGSELCQHCPVMPMIITANTILEVSILLTSYIG